MSLARVRLSDLGHVPNREAQSCMLAGLRLRGGRSKSDVASDPPAALAWVAFHLWSLLQQDLGKYDMLLYQPLT